MSVTMRKHAVTRNETPIVIEPRLPYTRSGMSARTSSTTAVGRLWDHAASAALTLLYMRLRLIPITFGMSSDVRPSVHANPHGRPGHRLSCRPHSRPAAACRQDPTGRPSRAPRPALTTATKWVKRAGGDWTTYTSQRARPGDMKLSGVQL